MLYAHQFYYSNLKIKCSYQVCLSVRIVTKCLGEDAAMDLSDEDKCKKNDDDKDDRNRDANQDGSVIRVSADRLRP